MKFKIDYKFLNLNETIDISRRNVYMANNSKKKEMEVVRLSTLKLKPIENYPIEVVFIWHIKNINSDLDNRIPKNLVDGLVNAGKLKGDSLKYINKITHEYIKDDIDFVEVCINEVNKCS